MRAGFGCLLIILAMVLLVAIIVIPVLPFTAQTDSIDALLSRALCQPGEQVVRDQYTTTDIEGTGFSMNVFCRNAAGLERDVTGRWAIIGGAAFLVPFLIGLTLFIVGVRKRPVPSETYSMAGVPHTPPARAYNPNSAPPSSAYDLSDIAPTMSIRPSQVQAAQQAQQAQTQETASAHFTQPIETSQPTQVMRPPVTDPNSLTAKLRQIEDARNSGLISAEEYERLRQEIIGNIS